MLGDQGTDEVLLARLLIHAVLPSWGDRNRLRSSAW
jgi:hypothetical protein